MSYKVESSPSFDRHAKKLAKKYPSLKADLKSLFDSLQRTPEQGAALGKGCYKVRMSISSKRQGKSGGARAITFVKVTRKTVFLLALYDKSEVEAITATEIDAYLRQINDLGIWVIGRIFLPSLPERSFTSFKNS